MTDVEYRCPRDRRTMFGKLIRLTPGLTFDVDDAIELPDHLEFSCPECRRVLGKRGLQVKRVLHSFRFNGEVIETRHEGGQ